MDTIHKLEQLSDTRAFIERVWFPKSQRNAMNKIAENGRTHGKVGMRRFIGNKHRLREVQPWDWQPSTLREAEIFRMPREDRGKHLLQFTPSSSAPVVKTLSFHERNLQKRAGARKAAWLCS